MRNGRIGLQNGESPIHELHSGIGISIIKIYVKYLSYVLGNPLSGTIKCIAFICKGKGFHSFSTRVRFLTRGSNAEVFLQCSIKAISDKIEK